MSGPSLLVTGRCGNVDGHGYICMVCQMGPAVGHLQIVGVEHDGRVVLVLCRGCTGPATDGARRDVLKRQVRAGLFNPLTGGPGPAGGPKVWHGDHYDQLDGIDDHGADG